MFWDCFGRAHYKREAEIKSVRKETPCGKQSHKPQDLLFLWSDDEARPGAAPSNWQ
jgi:hypothetical protein